MPLKDLQVKLQKILPLSTEFLHFSNKYKRQCYVLYPSRNPHCWSDKNLSKQTGICSKSILSKILGNVGRIRTGL